LKIRIARNDVEIGAYELEGLQQMANAGMLLPSDQVYVIKYKAWKTISEVPELFDIVFFASTSASNRKDDKEYAEGSGNDLGSSNIASNGSSRLFKYVLPVLALIVIGAGAFVFDAKNNSGQTVGVISQPYVQTSVAESEPVEESKPVTPTVDCGMLVQDAVKKINSSWESLTPELKIASKIRNERLQADQISDVYRRHIEIRQDVVDQLSSCSGNVDRDSLVSFIRNEQRFFAARAEYVEAVFDENQAMYRCPRSGMGFNTTYCREYHLASNETSRRIQVVNARIAILTQQGRRIARLGVVHVYKQM